MYSQEQRAGVQGGVARVLPVLSHCGAESTTPLDRNIYTLGAKYGNARQKAKYPSALDERLARALRECHGFRPGDNERMCSGCSAVCRDCYCKQAQACPPVQLADDHDDDESINIFVSTNQLVADGTTQEDPTRNLFGSVPSVATGTKRRRQPLHRRVEHTALGVPLPSSGSPIRKAVFKAEASPCAPTRCSSGDIIDPYIGATTVHDLADVDPRKRRHALASTPRLVSVFEGSHTPDGADTVLPSNSSLQLRHHSDSGYGLMLINPQVLSKASVEVPCSCRVRKPPTLIFFCIGSTPETCMGYWYRGCAKCFGSNMGALRKVPLSIPPIEAAFRAILAGGAFAYLAPQFFGYLGCPQPYSKSTLRRALKALRPILQRMLDDIFNRNCQRYVAYFRSLPVEKQKYILLCLDAMWSCSGNKGRQCMGSALAQQIHHRALQRRKLLRRKHCRKNE